MKQAIKDLLEEKYRLYNQSGFIEKDPIQIPHLFSKKQDVEIMGFITATLAWGQRTTIINNCKNLAELFDHAPHDFIQNHNTKDLERFNGFKHRTFNLTDLLYFIHFLKKHYEQHESLEFAFTKSWSTNDTTTEQALVGFHNYFVSLEDFPIRTRKHVATPARNSACKRLNMFLRWMVRPDEQGVDFGLWNTIEASQLLIPFDVHVERVARKLGLIKRKQRDFKTVLELTKELRKLDPLDPVKYDFALFGMGVEEKNDILKM